MPREETPWFAIKVREWIIGIDRRQIVNPCDETHSMQPLRYLPQSRREREVEMHRQHIVEKNNIGVFEKRHQCFNEAVFQFRKIRPRRARIELRLRRLRQRMIAAHFRDQFHPDRGIVAHPLAANHRHLMPVRREKPRVLFEDRFDSPHHRAVSVMQQGDFHSNGNKLA